MLGHRDMNLDDYVSILKRRYWLLLLPAFLLPPVAYGVSMLLPPMYTSQTLVLVEKPKVPASIVQPVVTDTLQDRLVTMQEQILSRNALQPIIEKLSLYKQEQDSKVPMEDLVAKMRRNVKVNIVRGSATSPNATPGFTISFTSDAPRTAQQVCQEITGLFIEKNLRGRSDKAKTITDFLGQQVADAKAKLDERDAKLKEFRTRYLGSLPGDEQRNLQLLMSANSQLEATTTILTRTQQDKTYTEAQLQQAIASWQASLQGSNPVTLDQQLQGLKAQLVSLEARYRPEHPDVIKLKGDIAALERKINEINSTPPDPDAAKSKLATIEPPQVQGLRAQIHNLNQTIQEKTRQQERLQEMIKVYRARVEVSPLVQQQYSDLMRDYGNAQQFHDSMAKNLQQAQVGKELEDQQQSEQFRVLDPPNLPVKPSFPNRLLFAAGGLAGGLMVGVGLILVLEIQDKSIRNERDIEALLHLPTLALVPSLAPVTSKRGSLFSLIRKDVAPPASRAEA